LGNYFEAERDVSGKTLNILDVGDPLLVLYNEVTDYETLVMFGLIGAAGKVMTDAKLLIDCEIIEAPIPFGF